MIEWRLQYKKRTFLMPDNQALLDQLDKEGVAVLPGFFSNNECFGNVKMN